MMSKQTLILGLAIGWFVFSTACGEELETPVPASLDEATTFEEIQAFVEHTWTESRKNLKTLEDQERFLEIYSPVGIAGGRKVIAFGGDDESLEYGYGILLHALDLAIRRYPDNAEHAKEWDTIIEELKKSEKFPKLVNNARFYSFYRQSRRFTEKIPKNKFDAIKDEFNAMKEEAKDLLIPKPTNHNTSGPTELVLEMARDISIANNTPDFLNDVLEEMVRFVTSDHFKNKKENEAYLRGYCRRMTGSSLELWGKTVDGNDFNWADYKGKVVLIDFTASWCGPCRAEMPNVVEMYDKYHDKGLEVICVGYEDETDNLKKMIEEDKIVFPMISEELSKDDLRGLPSEHYGIRGIPEIFLIGKDGRIVATGLRGPTLRDNVEKQFVDAK
jgi:thiol-disulfide isomerase/thioredoxin